MLASRKLEVRNCGRWSMMTESRHAATYPTEEQYQRWQDRADDLGMLMSEFVECMVEAGMKKFDATVAPDETNQELRDQRNDLKTELDRARGRIDQLEDELYRGERRAIREYVEANPGATYDEIVQHVINTAANRVTVHIDGLESDAIQVETDGGTDLYYPVTDGGDS